MSQVVSKFTSKRNNLFSFWLNFTWILTVLTICLSTTLAITIFPMKSQYQNSEGRSLFISDWYDDFTDKLEWRHWLYQLGWGLVCLSWIMCYGFLFRLFLISGEVWFIVWAWVEQDVELDTTIWNGVFILINLFYIFWFFLSKKSTKLTPKEQEIYNNDFWTYFSKKDFKALMKLAEINIIKGPDSIFEQGELMTHLHYCHIISRGWLCQLKLNSKEIYSINNSDWISIFDSTNWLKEDANNPEWSVMCQIMKATEKAHLEMVAFPIKKLQRYFRKKGQAKRVKRSLEAYWFHKRCQYLDEVSLFWSSDNEKLLICLEAMSCWDIIWRRQGISQIKTCSLLLF